MIKSIMTGLFVEDGILYFLFGEEKFVVTEFYQVLLEEKSDVENKFSLINGNDVIVSFLYSKPDAKLNVSPFEYIDEDDFNWGEFIAKVVNDKERQRSFIKNLMEG